MRRTEAPALEGATRASALATLRTHLRRSAIDTAEADARSLLYAACGIDGSEMLLNPDAILGSQEAARLREFVERRTRREPVSRIVGRRAFWTVDLTVRPDVLDPRADTETLVRLAVRAAGGRGATPARILDLGSGSGALLCALLSEFGEAFGVAVDLSPEACAASAANLRACGVASRSAVLQGDWFDPVSGKFDLVVSNPPYIATEEIGRLDLEVYAHDPHLALDGGSDGLDAYRRILVQAPSFMSPDGVLGLEIGAGQKEQVEALASSYALREIGFERDLGGHVRAIAFVASSRSVAI